MGTEIWPLLIRSTLPTVGNEQSSPCPQQLSCYREDILPAFQGGLHGIQEKQLSAAHVVRDQFQVAAPLLDALSTVDTVPPWHIPCLAAPRRDSALLGQGYIFSGHRPETPEHIRTSKALLLWGSKGHHAPT